MKNKNRKTDAKKSGEFFSRSLFKQSCKASGTMWSIVTFAVCFMLACVMLISGGKGLSATKNAIQNTIIKDELTSQIKNRAIEYYYISEKGLSAFDEEFSDAYVKTDKTPEAQKAYDDVYNDLMSKAQTPFDEWLADVNAKLARKYYVTEKAYKIGMDTLFSYMNDVAVEGGTTLEELKPEIEKLLKNEPYNQQYFDVMEKELIIIMVFNPMFEMNEYLFDDYYAKNDSNGNAVDHHYDLNKISGRYDQRERTTYRNEYAIRNSTIVLAGNLIGENSINIILETLKGFGVTRAQYDEYGFSDFNNVKEIGVSALIDFKANFDYRMLNKKEGETEEKIYEELVAEVANSLLASLPRQVSEALAEIGQLDLFGTLVGSIFFRMAGLLLPIIYLSMTANALIAGQVDSGSMAYILSSSIKRKTVVITQASYLVLSLFAMFLCTSITSVICLAIVQVETSLNFAKILLINLGAFLVSFAMSGICFMASCWFNRSKNSMAIGGGLCMFFLVATMLGLFGSPIIPSIVRMSALNVFNYVSIISFFDVTSILEGSLKFLWQFAILVGIGGVCYFLGGKKFESKDLPL